MGDTVTIKGEEAVTNAYRWDPQCQVIRVQWHVHWVHQVTGKERKLNREKLTIADPAIIWDELPNRVKRAKWKTMRTRRPVVQGGSQGRVVTRARADPKIDKPKVRALCEKDCEAQNKNYRFTAVKRAGYEMRAGDESQVEGHVLVVHHEGDGASVLSPLAGGW